MCGYIESEGLIFVFALATVLEGIIVSQRQPLVRIANTSSSSYAVKAWFSDGHSCGQYSCSYDYYCYDCLARW